MLRKTLSIPRKRHEWVRPKPVDAPTPAKASKVLTEAEVDRFMDSFRRAFVDIGIALDKGILPECGGLFENFLKGLSDIPVRVERKGQIEEWLRIMQRWVENRADPNDEIRESLRLTAWRWNIGDILVEVTLSGVPRLLETGKFKLAVMHLVEARQRIEGQVGIKGSIELRDKLIELEMGEILKQSAPIVEMQINRMRDEAFLPEVALCRSRQSANYEGLFESQLQYILKCYGRVQVELAKEWLKRLEMWQNHPRSGLSLNLRSQLANIQRIVQIAVAEDAPTLLAGGWQAIKERLTEMEDGIGMMIEAGESGIRISRYCWDQHHAMISALYDYATEFLGPPPCKLALIDLGSSAKTRYSDIEYMILVEDQSVENGTEAIKPLAEKRARESQAYAEALAKIIELEVWMIGESTESEHTVSGFHIDEGIPDIC